MWAPGLPLPSGRGKLEQIQFLLGHMSVQTTDRYLGSKQRIHMPRMIELASNNRSLLF
jgi:hypothetical protein